MSMATSASRSPPADRRSRRRPARLRRLGRVVRARPGGDVVDQLSRDGPSALGAALADQRVAHGAQQVAELVLAAHVPRSCEHPRIGLLDEILSFLT
jgi:hypothetical protein